MKKIKEFFKKLREKLGYIIYVENKIFRTEHKYFSIQSGFWKWRVSSLQLSFNIKYRSKVDHAGFNFQIEILNFYFMFNIYDNRHWCDTCDMYQTETCYKENHDY